MCYVVLRKDVNDMKRHALRLLQCRVLLLAHASNCTHEKRKCQLSPLCDSVRQLLRHMQACMIRYDRLTPGTRDEGFGGNTNASECRDSYDAHVPAFFFFFFA